MRISPSKPFGGELDRTHPCDLSRVVVVGTSGAGKTTFARALAEVLGAPHIELDVLHWKPSWTPRGRDEFRALTAQAVAGDRWLVDGNYHVVRDIVWPRATAVVWLNYPFPLVFWRVFRRTVRRLIFREPLFAGNRESFRQTFLSQDSMLWWVITTYARRRTQFRTLFDDRVFPHLSLIEFRRPDQAGTFLDSLKSKAPHVTCQ